MQRGTIGQAAGGGGVVTIDLAADSAVFMTDFAETVEFRVNSGASARSISANVNRQPIEESDGSPFGGRPAPTMHVMVRNNDTEGVTPDEVVDDTSEIKVAFKIGEDARWRPVHRVLRQNTGCVLLEVSV